MPTHFLPLTQAFVSDTREKIPFHLALSGPFAKLHFRRVSTIPRSLEAHTFGLISTSMVLVDYSAQQSVT